MIRILKLCLVISALCPLSWLHAQTTVVVTHEGEAAPDGNGTFFGFETPVLNNAGQAAFVASLTGTTGGFSDDRP